MRPANRARTLPRALLIVAAALAFPTAGAGPAAAQAVAAGGEITSQIDAAFLSQTAQAAATQVLLARVVAERATTPEVARLAAEVESGWMVRGQRLSNIAHRRGLTAPTTPDPRGRGAVLRLSGLPAGVETDREWALHQIGAASTLIAALEQAQAGAAWPEVRAFAAEILPEIEAERAAAQALEQALR